LTHYPTAKTTDLLGFSQGGATAARWATAGVVKCSHFISWASIFPPEVEINGFTQQVDKLSFVIGNDDIYFQGDNYDQALAWYREMNATIVPFSGKHDIDIETLTTLL
jgi:predicted esterase